MTCKTCTHWTPRRNADMARQGFAVCAVGSAFTFLAPQHTCGRHERAAPEIQQARKAWLSKRQPKDTAPKPSLSPQEVTPWWQE